MSCPLYPPSTGYFYPLGNTPAISLTQDLSPEQSADILLLGCGDPRNVLYTLYADVVASSTPRKLDITCCDLEPAVLARNILLFTLLEEQEDIDRIWDIFYHFKINDQATEILTRQSQRLYESAQSIETWYQSSYGSFIKFMDTRTLAELRRHWSSYAEFPNIPASRLNKLVQEQVRFSKSIESKPLNIGPSRSAGMLWLKAATPLADLYKHYWKTGTISRLASDIEAARNLNATFVYSVAGEAFSPYDGTFPQGFHLAPAYASILSDPMDPNASNKAISPADLYKRQFKAWRDSFRKSRTKNRITIRFYAGDAIAFCRALDIYATMGSIPKHLFTCAWRLDTIDLDLLAASVTPPPLNFDVVETSNLMDHIGQLNLLIIAQPLLKESPASQSVLYTEQLLHSDENGTHPFTERIFATIPTISALFGLAPLAWVSGFTSHSNVHEGLAGVSQSVERITWVDPSRGDHHVGSRRPVISFEADDLARVLFGIYEKIFEPEQMFSGILPNMPTISKGEVHSMAVTHYHRETIACLFQLVKRRVCLKAGTWSDVVNKFLDVVQCDRSRKSGMQLYEDLRLQLHLYGVHTVDLLDRSQNGLMSVAAPPVDQIIPPSIICVVFTVPRAGLKILLKNEFPATPTLQCNLLYGDGGVCAFSSIQAIWGETIIPPGAKLALKEDPEGAKGKSGLVVLFWIPYLITSGEITDVELAFKPSFATAPYLNILGPKMTLFSANFHDEKYVRLLPYRPTTTSNNPLVADDMVIRFPTPTLSAPSISILAVTGHLRDQPSVISFNAHVEIEELTEQKALLNGADVSATQASPCTMNLSIANRDHLVSYPYPIFGVRHKLRVARKSHYVEIIVPVSEPLDAGGYALDRAPMLRRNAYSPWNIHHINLDRMPLLDVQTSTNLGWLNSHTALQLSDRERAIMGGKGNTKDTTSKLLGAIKDTIHSLPNHYSGSWGKKDSVFGLCEASGDVYAVLFVGGLRLDLASFTVIVDTAIVPLADNTEHKMVPLLDKLVKVNRVYRLSAMGDEPTAWRKLLPVFIERSRTWSHKANCEYDSRGKIPLSTRMGESPLCTCGQGVGFEGAEWKNPAWKPLLPFATRAAISPLFFVPYIENAKHLVEDLQTGMLDGPDAGLASRLELTNRCWGCGGAGNPSLSACAKCKRARYCSATCQRQDWKKHKPNCKPA
ncbi:hypothetical protein FRC12_007759 [Ceratobasidium sp. 428]|nr:hypothetical protein FRC12_007759 [Ceratobasidium sp. 428]